MDKTGTMHNEVWLAPEGYVEVKLAGEQSLRAIEAVGKACRPLMDKLNYEHKPILGLIDLTDDHSINSGANKAALGLLESIPYHRAAMYGANLVMTEVARGLIAALGKGGNTKVFGERDEALAWLLMNDPLAG